MAVDPSQFYVAPLGGRGPEIMSGLGEAIGGVFAEKKARREQQAATEEVQAALDSADPRQIANVSIKYPQISQQIKDAASFISKETEGIAQNAYREVITSGGNQEKALGALEQASVDITAKGGKPTNIDNDIDALRRGDENIMEQIELGVATIFPDMWEASQKIKEGKEKSGDTYKMGTGDMAGYSFNQDTGTFSIDPEIKASLAADAEKTAAKTGMLSSKDIAGVNDKVTALTKDTSAIVKSAMSLQALKANSSAASKLAAVFQFMKSLDPTSVVRETEQGQVYAASGAAAQLAGKINSLLGEGALSESGFQDLVNTSNILANSAIDGSSKEVTSYLDVLSDKIPPEDLKKLQSRVPQRLGGGIGGGVGGTGTTPLTNQQGWRLQEDASGNRAYVGPNGEIEEI